MSSGDPAKQPGSLPISLFDYDLPQELIAQEPLAERTASRLLTVDRSSGQIEHARFADIGRWLTPGDVLVINDTRVFPARLHARRTTGGHVEILLVEHLEHENWLAMARPSRRLKIGEELEIERPDGSLTRFSARVIEKRSDGLLLVELPESAQVLDAAGQVPLPGYIHQVLDDDERYQTVYARESGSVAAPTAGLHFSSDQLAELQRSGVDVAAVTLHVGPGTFQPVKVDDALQHVMHAERFSVPEATLQQLRRARSEGGRVIAVGTTSCRTLESIADRISESGPVAGETSIYITPGFEFKVIDGLITNFHLPKSTLLLLVSAFAGRELVLRAYRQAIQERYRFYSFGDAMLIM